MSFLNQALARRKAARLRGERGAVAVEAAIITPLLVLLVFGIVEYGLLFKDSLAVTTAIRSGARTASAEPRQTTFAQDAADQVAKASSALKMANVQALWVYDSQANGAPVGGSLTFGTCTVCVKFTWNATTSHFDQSSSTWTATQQNACVGDPLHDTLGVYMKINHPSITGLIFSNIVIKDHVIMALEPIPSSTGCK